MIRRPWLWYLGWTALCALLFVVVADFEDPSRPKGRILSIEAGRRALEIAKSRGMRDVEVVHVARARAGEGGREERWIVLIDQVPHTRLDHAFVFELRASDGKLLTIRKPVR